MLPLTLPLSGLSYVQRLLLDASDSISRRLDPIVRMLKMINQHDLQMAYVVIVAALAVSGLLIVLVARYTEKW